MDVFEITGFLTGRNESGVNYLEPGDSFESIENGFIYREVLQSRQGVGYFAPQLSGQSRVMGIFEHILPDSTKELLAFDLNNLYRFNPGTGVFDLIPFGGSLAAYPGFNISANDFYISGCSYPTKSNTERFIFCGKGISIAAGGSSIFYYDGTNVLDFTVDDADYAAPTSGTLTKAEYVIFFNGRLNFGIPTINTTVFNQTILFSGIRNAAGNGDKFNVPGSGELVFDTSENITGINILGQVLNVSFNRSTWTAEKTKDPFNPYFSRKVPSVIGTNAKFSGVNWADRVISLGNTGIIGSDGRQQLKIDDKIYRFTADEISQKNFNMTYGGFDRVNNQFLWSYLETSSLSTTQNKVLVNNYEEETWSVYDQRFSVFGQTDLGIEKTWDDINETSGNDSWARWDTTTDIWDRIGLEVAVQKTLAGDDLGFIYNINQDFDDYFSTITAISLGTTTVITINPTAFQIGDKVTVQDVVGVLNSLGESVINNFDPEIDNPYFIPWTVIARTLTSITINLDSSLATSYVSGGSVSKVISFSAKTIPFNPYRSIGRKCNLSFIEFLIDNNNGDLTSNMKVDIYADEDEEPYKSDVLCKPTPGSTKARQWITVSATNEASFHTIVMRQESPAVQLKVTSLRLHCQPGGLNSG